MAFVSSVGRVLFRATMAFVSFVGRLFFVSFFILSAWQEFVDISSSKDDTANHRFNEYGVDDGLAAKSMGPKFNAVSKLVSTNVGVQVPEIEIKHLVAAAIALKGVGGLFFIFGHSLGAYLLLLHQAIDTAVLYDFCNSEIDKKEFEQLLVKFTQSLALLGALLFFIGMKNLMPKRLFKKKAHKTKII